MCEVPVVQGLLEQWLFDAVRNHDLEDAKLRLRQGAAVDGVQARAPENGRTALHETAACGTADIARQLLEAGADPNARDTGGKTPLHWACREANHEVGAVLLAANADPNAATDDNAWSPLHFLAQHWTQDGGAAFAEALIHAGADFEKLSALDETPLAISARYDNECVARLLVSHGATPDGDGRIRLSGALPPLAVAAYSGSSNVARLLAESGGHVFERCQGLRAASTASALGLARAHGHNRIALAIRGPVASPSQAAVGKLRSSKGKDRPHRRRRRHRRTPC
ncbi:Ankyrin repeat domain-containing protein 1 [Hondaea fermentalgiana]|uniref:Ankyrin repeat domain-containing protein 1 n=1 Tax=Hondaea fermentalgiana TaxID=2315210 RepID=A0A2R5GL96_9STRA|nr:Ankyrin repeat domain-containing protein 1 [Hondaea fermentalgiana]|eukprot:GBG31682.1 Ankyrin repeat domain-containing protein 1 [Hondaea fermentalgiana]